MSDTQTPVARILSPLRQGRVEAGSDKGRKLIQEALKQDPDETVRIVKPIDAAALREGMRSAAFSEDRILELVRSPGLDVRAVTNPFADKPTPQDPTPFPDPGEELRRGPRPR